MTASDLTATSVVGRHEGILHSEVDQEVVALSIESGMCFGLNPVGSRVWQLMAEPVRIGDLCETLVAEYDVEREQCEREVIGLLQEALAEGMIKVVPLGEPPGNAIGA